MTVYLHPVRTDYVLVEMTNVNWPGVLPWRGPHSRKGYATEKEAADRALFITARYIAKHGGTDGPVFNVEKRER